MTKIKLADCPPGSQVRLALNTALLTVQFHTHGQTRLIVTNGNGIDGGWRGSNEDVYLEKQ